jgi:hypothetical protein
MMVEFEWKVMVDEKGEEIDDKNKTEEGTAKVIEESSSKISDPIGVGSPEIIVLIILATLSLFVCCMLCYICNLIRKDRKKGISYFTSDDKGFEIVNTRGGYTTTVTSQDLNE